MNVGSSSLTRDQTWAPCIGTQSLNHCATREVPLTVVLKGCFYVRVSLCSLCVFNIFGARADFGIDTSQVFLQGVLVIIPLIGGAVGVVGSRTCAGCEVRLPLSSVAITTC